MSRFAVIDTETTWSDEVMSIGIAVSDFAGFGVTDKKYYILTPFKDHGGMYSNALYIRGITPDLESDRLTVTYDIKNFLAEYEIRDMFAYNAVFDCRHLPELQYLDWYDIMRLAAYRQYNSAIPSTAECYSTGKLKRGYGVESVYRMLSGNDHYREFHNALTDALDELEIMRMLKCGLAAYSQAKITAAVI